MDCLPQHGCRRQRHSRALHRMLPVSDCALSGQWRSKPRRSQQGTGLHKQFLDVSSQRRLLNLYSPEYCGRRTRSWDFPGNGR